MTKKKTSKKPAVKKVPVGTLVDALRDISDSHTRAIGKMQGAIDFHGNQINELPRFRNSITALESEVGRLRSVLARNYEADVEDGVKNKMAAEVRGRCMGPSPMTVENLVAREMVAAKYIRYAGAHLLRLNAGNLLEYPITQIQNALKQLGESPCKAEDLESK